MWLVLTFSVTQKATGGSVNLKGRFTVIILTKPHSPIIALHGIAHSLHQKTSKCLCHILPQEGRFGVIYKEIKQWQTIRRALQHKMTSQNHQEKLSPNWV